MSDTGQSGRHHGGAWVGGAILIAVGVVFLLSDMGYSLPANWWAIFILIPAVAALVRAWRIWQGVDGPSDALWGPLVSGIILAVISVALFFGVDLGAIWPILLILLGVVVIFGNVWRQR